jgi:hypothetical protein
MARDYVSGKISNNLEDLVSCKGDSIQVQADEHRQCLVHSQANKRVPTLSLWDIQVPSMETGKVPGFHWLANMPYFQKFGTANAVASIAVAICSE